ncbi:hypothetical protein N657DRAFT_248316 [Parathielavia appendiculata]|uniref:Uncharacterized protein n=1 Tax=Parathielavia appendiculata TaxID=2587402 RepID=A0AAN6TS70_9PEZI|nr:hypothetical protein N657DRAFT_248316 [Parathielavia appendiculata]
MYITLSSCLPPVVLYLQVLAIPIRFDSSNSIIASEEIVPIWITQFCQQHEVRHPCGGFHYAHGPDLCWAM